MRRSMSNNISFDATLTEIIKSALSVNMSDGISHYIDKLEKIISKDQLIATQSAMLDDAEKLKIKNEYDRAISNLLVAEQRNKQLAIKAANLCETMRLLKENLSPSATYSPSAETKDREAA